MSDNLSSESYRAIFDAVSDALFLHDFETGAILDANQGAAEMFGYTHEEILRLNLEHMSANEAPYTAADVARMVQKVVETGSQFFEWRSKRKSGELFWSEVSLTCLTLDGQKRVLAVVRDVSERKQAELEREQMLKQLRRLAAVLENIPDLVSMIDLDGKIVYTNPAGLAMMGRNGQDAIPLEITDVHPPEMGQRTTEEHLPAIMKHGIHSWENLLQHVDGHTIPVSQVSMLIRNDEGEPEAMATIMRDLSAQKQAETEQERLQQEIIEAQRRSIQELSTPIIPVMDRIIVMPLIGSIDTMRARDIMRTLLGGIRENRAKVVIMDITGVPLVDSGVANHLNKTIQAARLKGARTIITGVSDAVAETVVDLGIDWGDVETLADLRTGLLVALASLGLKLNKA